MKPEGKISRHSRHPDLRDHPPSLKVKVKRPRSKTSHGHIVRIDPTAHAAPAPHVRTFPDHAEDTLYSLTVPRVGGSPRLTTAPRASNHTRTSTSTHGHGQATTKAGRARRACQRGDGQV